jgi:hypothetical protein
MKLLVLVCLGSAVAIDESEAPIKRVIGLLEKMKSELQAEADNDASLYDKMVCWCETSEKEKTLAVATAEQNIKDLQSEIEERAARFGELETEVAQMKKQIAQDTAALKEATAAREGEAGSFRQSEKETVQAMTNLKNAIRVLGKVQFLQGDSKGASLAQFGLTKSQLSGIRVVLRDVAYQHELLMARKPMHASLLQSGSASKSAALQGQELLKELIGDEVEELPLKFASMVIARSAGSSAHGATSFLQVSQPTNSGSYNSASGPIFGILTTMMDEFTADLKTSQDDEAKAVADFNAMEAAKTEQIKVGKEKLDELEAENAANQKGLADAKENLQLTTDQRAADVEFLRNLKLTCNDLDSQWEARSKVRSEEITAVAETITILTDDDNAEQLKAGGVFAQGVSLIELSEQSKMKALRNKAAAALRKAADSGDFDSDDLLASWRNRAGARSTLGASAGPRAQLSALAVSVRLDQFTKIKEIMDKLVAELKEQQKEEVAFKAYCIKELDENEKATFHKSEEKEDLETKIKQLQANMDKLAEEIQEANDQISKTQLETKQASQSREKENAAFQQVVSDQRATQGILNKALQRLKDFYAKRLSGFVQVNGQQTPPVHFKPMGKSAGASPVMGLIEQIIEDSIALEKETITTEYEAQADYEKLVKDSNALIKDLQDTVTTKTKASAQASKDQNQATTDRDMANDELESLGAYEADLHGQCDFVLKNFDIRQKARLQEMDAIGEAKAILSGSK